MRIIDNIFYKIIKNEASSFTIYEDDDFKVILDRFPSSLGHTLIIPKTPFEDIFSMPDDVAAKIMLLAKKTACVLKEKYNCPGINILQNNGLASGQTIAYFHMHLIPRYNSDNVNISWENMNYADTDFVKTADDLKAIFLSNN